MIACKKDNHVKVNETEKNVQGTWLTTNEQHIYYDSNDAELYRESKAIGFKYQLSVEKNIRKFSPEGVQIFKAPYELSKSAGKLYISFNDNLGPQIFEVVSAEEQTMRWVQKSSNQPYDGGTKTAAKKVITIDFHCPCPLH